MPVNGEVLTRVRASLAAADLTVVGEDLGRPWGGFLVIANADVRKFTEIHFSNTGLNVTSGPAILSPKILIVAPGHRLSWQYHLRRSEIWRVVEGPVAISRGPGDNEPAARSYQAGDLLQFELGERHRLAGIDRWGLVAEIWQHTDSSSPSDEHDIVRVTDDHDRT